jgi:hypothetical protein
MPRGRRAPAGMHFTRFRQEQQDGLRALMHLPGIKEHFDEVARDGHQHEGRGLLVWLSTDGKLENLKPPAFVSAPSWRREPLLINTPHPDLLQALITYDPMTSYIVLVASPNPDNPTTAGWYTWWVGLFAQDVDMPSTA